MKPSKPETKKKPESKEPLKAPLRHLSRRQLLKDSSDLKRETFYALENFTHGNLLARIIGVALFALILANAVLVFITTQPNLDEGWSRAFDACYRFSTACFCIEYIARIWIADLYYPDLSPSRARLHYILSGWGIIDLLSFLPNLIAWFVPMSPVLRNTINIIRLVRLLKISRYMRGLRTIARVLEKRRHEIVAAFLVVALLVVVSSVVMYEIEHPAQPDKFNNLLSGIYWAVTTVTATGYGDLVPITPAGRIAGSVIMFLSVALVAIPAGIFSAGFVAEFQNAKLRRLEHDVKKDDKKSDRGSTTKPDTETTTEPEAKPETKSGPAES